MLHNLGNPCYSRRMNQKTFRIIRPVGLKPLPDKYEEKIAELCANYFQSDITFVLRGNHTTPDIQVMKTGQFWEIKNIKSNGKHAIEDNLRKASKQSDRIIISLLRCSKADATQAESRICHILKTKRMPISRALLVLKTGEIIDIK